MCTGVEGVDVLLVVGDAASGVVPTARGKDRDLGDIATDGPTSGEPGPKAGERVGSGDLFVSKSVTLGPARNSHASPHIMSAP